MLPVFLTCLWGCLSAFFEKPGLRSFFQFLQFQKMSYFDSVLKTFQHFLKNKKSAMSLNPMKKNTKLKTQNSKFKHKNTKSKLKMKN